jgi:type IV fimbrial biogenesis protein FimT
MFRPACSPRSEDLEGRAHRTDGADRRLHTHPRGLTLVELMVVLVVLAIVAAQALPALADQLDRRRLVAVSTDVAAALQAARSEAQLGGRSIGASLQATGVATCLLIHTGPAADCRCTAHPVCTAPSELLRAVVLPQQGGIALSANVASMRYDPRWGTTTPTGTVRITARTGALHHIVNLAGRVRTCSPAPPLPGYAAC